MIGKRALGRNPFSGGRQRLITVVLPPGEKHRGWLRCGALMLPCAVGRTGVSHLKREGDGATPAGRLRLLRLTVRRDRLPGPRTAVPARATGVADGWCDDPVDGRYNRPIHLPARAGHEAMRRDDQLYDVVGVLDWNLSPRIRRAGSAIFLHVARDDFAPTAGCIAVRLPDLKRLLEQAGGTPVFLVGAKPRRLGRRFLR